MLPDSQVMSKVVHGGYKYLCVLDVIDIDQSEIKNNMRFRVFEKN